VTSKQTNKYLNKKGNLLIMKSIISIASLITAITLSTNVYAAPLYSIVITGHVVPDNAAGALGSTLQGRNFEFNATFELDINKAVGSRINGDGQTVYQLDDGGNLYTNSVCIDGAPDLAGSNCFSSTIVEFEYNDNGSEDWASNPNLQFLGLNVPDGTTFDALVLGLGDPDSDLEFYTTLIFPDDWVDGLNPANLPDTVDISQLVVGAGEFAIINGNVEEFAQILVDSVELQSVNAVPVPAAAWLFGSGLIGLVAVARRKKI
jgi:hypothetical protein